MLEVSAIASAVTSLSALKDIAQAMVGLRDGAAFQVKLIEFQSKILDAQDSVFAANMERSALIERVRQLEKEAADLKAWDAEKQRYKLEEISHGTFAYALKEEERDSEPTHHVCANCYNRGIKSILQSLSPNVYKCDNCSSKIWKNPTNGRPGD